MSCLYILNINPLLVTTLVWLFILLMVSFASQNLSLIRSNLFIFAFVSFALGERSKKYCYNLCQSVLPMFSSRNFRVSGLTFRSLIHFDPFLYMVLEKCFNFILLHVAVQFSQHHFLKRLFFSPVYILASFVID